MRVASLKIRPPFVSRVTHIIPFAKYEKDIKIQPGYGFITLQHNPGLRGGQMSKARLLIVEDDFDIANMLKIYFTGQDYQVHIASRGSDALSVTRKEIPHLIILDIMLPDIDGYEICRQLRLNTRTSHIPVIFLTQKDERSDKLQGLELGADDYITKPFDIEELSLRVHNAIKRSERESLTDPRSGLPAGRLIEDQLREIIRRDDWAYMDIRIHDFEPFREVYGFVAGDNVLRFTAMLLNEIVDEYGTSADFIGHAGRDHFIIISSPKQAPLLKQKILQEFNQKILSYYHFIDRENNFLTHMDDDGRVKQYPIMHLTFGVVSPATHQFTDIREITELAVRDRRS